MVEDVLLAPARDGDAMDDSGSNVGATDGGAVAVASPSTQWMLVAQRIERSPSQNPCANRGDVLLGLVAWCPEAGMRSPWKLGSGLGLNPCATVF